MKRSSACDTLVRKWEGYHKRLPNDSCEAYPDVATGDEPWTIGYGTTYYQRAGKLKYGRTKVCSGDTLTRAEAEQELDAELDQIEDALNERVKAPVTQSMWDALCSFAFNLGLAGSAQQIARINARAYEECARSFDLYINASGRPFQGLINRRNEEEALFRKDGLVPTGAPQTPIDAPVSTQGRPYAPCPVPLPWTANLVRSLLPTSSNYYLQCALIGLGYLRKPKDSELVGDVFNEHVEYAVKRLQEAQGLIVDGVVGYQTRKGIEASLTRARTPKPPVDNSVATLKCIQGEWHTGRWDGLKVLNLGIGSDTFRVASGQPGRQRFRKAGDPDSVPGSMEPIPQGLYTFHREPEFVNGKDNYTGSWGEGLGPVWHGLRNAQSMRRGSFGLHLDPPGASGSAGCIVFRDVDDLKRYAKAWREFRPKELRVDWNL
jgi:GH24 family phage-related lysozyme (muramidase)